MRYFKSILKAIMTIAAKASKRLMMTKGMKAAEHTPVAQAPDIEEKQDGILEGIAPYLCRLTATGTVVSPVMRAAGCTLVLLLGERRHLMRLQLPLLVSFVSIL